MQHKIHWCYLCRDEDHLTSDHVPPKNLFPTPRPANLITVPCCRKCNESFSGLDEQFRAFITAAADASPVGKEMFRSKVCGSSFKRSPALRKQMGRGLTQGKMITGAGEMWVPLIAVNRKPFEGFFIRLTKGLLATFYPDIDYHHPEVAFVVKQYGSHYPSFHTVTSQLLADQRSDGVFRFWRGVAQDASRAKGLWIYQFYEAAVFMVTHDSAPSTDACPSG
jgi:hypothetical protein